MDADLVREREKWTLFGNEAEKVEVDVIRNQQLIRTRMDRMSLRQEVGFDKSWRRIEIL